jgi:hypothetical protein
MSDELRLDRDKRFLEFMARRFFQTDAAPPDQRPLAQFELIAKRSKALAIRGLRQAIGDCLVATSRLTPQEVRELNQELEKINLPLLTEMRRIFWSKYKHVLKNGVIKNDDDYYMLKGILEDSTKKEPNELAKLYQMISAYEGT